MSVEYVASTNRKLMTGTTGKLNYIVMKSRDGSALGGQVLYASHSVFGFAIALHVRAAALPSNPKKQGEWAEMWPEFNWYLTNSERASTTIIRYTGKRMAEVQFILDNLDGYAKSLVDYIGEKAGPVDEPDDVVTYIKSFIEPVLQSVLAGTKAQIEATSGLDLGIVYDAHNDLVNQHGHVTLDTLGNSAADQAAAPVKSKFEVIQGGKSHTLKLGGKSAKSHGSDADFDIPDEVKDEDKNEDDE